MTAKSKIWPTKRLLKLFGISALACTPMIDLGAQKLRDDIALVDQMIEIKSKQIYTGSCFIMIFKKYFILLLFLQFLVIILKVEINQMLN